MDSLLNPWIAQSEWCKAWICLPTVWLRKHSTVLLLFYKVLLNEVVECSSVNHDASILPHYTALAMDASILLHYTELATDASILPHYTALATDASILPHYTALGTDALILLHYTALGTDALILPRYTALGTWQEALFTRYKMITHMHTN